MEQRWQFTKENYREGVPPCMRISGLHLWSQFGGDVIGGELVADGLTTVINEFDFVVLRDGIITVEPCEPAPTSHSNGHKSNFLVAVEALRKLFLSR